MFGYYPWRCVRCQATTLLKARRLAEKGHADGVETVAKKAA